MPVSLIRLRCFTSACANVVVVVTRFCLRPVVAITIPFSQLLHLRLDYLGRSMSPCDLFSFVFQLVLPGVDVIYCRSSDSHLLLLLGSSVVAAG